MFENENHINKISKSLLDTIKQVSEAKKLDPVGKEDSDIDNDGKANTKSDKYLMHRRQVRSAAIQEGKPALDPVGQEDADIDNDGKSNTVADKYLLNRRKVRTAAIQKEEADIDEANYGGMSDSAAQQVRKNLQGADFGPVARPSYAGSYKPANTPSSPSPGLRKIGKNTPEGRQFLQDTKPKAPTDPRLEKTKPSQSVVKKLPKGSFEEETYVDEGYGTLVTKGASLVAKGAKAIGRGVSKVVNTPVSIADIGRGAAKVYNKPVALGPAAIGAVLGTEVGNRLPDPARRGSSGQGGSRSISGNNPSSGSVRNNTPNTPSNPGNINPGNIPNTTPSSGIKKLPKGSFEEEASLEATKSNMFLNRLQERRDPMMNEPITGGPDTVPLTPERKQFLKDLEARNRENAAMTTTPYAVSTKPAAKPVPTAKPTPKPGIIDRIKGMFNEEELAFLESQEEIQIDEITKKKASKFIDDATDSLSDKSISNLASKGGFEQGERGDEDSSAGEKEDRKAVRRSKMVALAGKKLAGRARVNATNEEVQQIDEVGDTHRGRKALGSYVKKASHSAANKGMEHGAKKAEADEMDRVMNRHMSFSDKDKVRDIMKTTTKDVERPREKAMRRLQGIDRAVSRLTKEEVDQIDEAKIWHGDYTATSEKSKFGGHRPKVIHKEKGHTMYLGQHSYDKPEIARKHAEAYLTAYSHQGEKSAESAVHDFVKANKNHMHEEAEQIDESMSSNDRYIETHNAVLKLHKSIGELLNNHKKDAVAHRNHYDGRKGPNWGHVGDIDHLHSQLKDIHDRLAQKGEYEERGRLVPRLSEDLDEETNTEAREKIQSTPRKTSLARTANEVMMRNQAIQKQVIDEAKRGRPKKNATPEEQKEEPQALGMQVRKAITINKPITFANGETKEIHPRHAEAFQAHMAARKTTQDKAAFQKQAHKSHKDFVAAVTQDMPKSSRGHVDVDYR